jgi:hypothetical protein
MFLFDRDYAKAFSMGFQFSSQADAFSLPISCAMVCKRVRVFRRPGWGSLLSDVRFRPQRVALRERVAQVLRVLWCAWQAHLCQGLRLVTKPRPEKRP